MNKQPTPLDNLVQSLTNALTLRSGKGNNVQNRKRGKSRRRQTASRRSPLALQVPRNQGLNLTSSQFTATSPLNLFSTTPGSTPGGIRVKGRELINSVSSDGALTGGFALANNFGGVGTNLGAGNPAAFSRLVNYGALYEYFIFHKVTYIFQSNQPTTAAGEVILAIDYDPTDANPTNTKDMMRNISSTMANIYSDASLQVLKSLSRIPRYETVPTTTFAETLQQLQYKLIVALEGVTAPAVSTFGYIIADYEVEFFTPQ